MNSQHPRHEHADSEEARGCRRLMAVCHCVLNPAAKVVSFNQEEYEAERVLRERAVHALLQSGVGLIQLPCPEFTLYGALRWGHVKEQFDNPFFRAHCRTILAPVMAELAEYAAHPERFSILGVLGIDGSPCCGVSKTCTGEWGGELYCTEQTQRVLSPAREADGMGVFMEELALLLKERGLALPLFSLAGFSPDPIG
ncbi:MAG TPA: hypothetical protein VN366_02980 [Feifaniaceae bacterium]|nr:hypothetical protein [Feifaniaceae bacterium]